MSYQVGRLKISMIRVLRQILPVTLYLSH